MFFNTCASRFRNVAVNDDVGCSKAMHFQPLSLCLPTDPKEISGADMDVCATCRLTPLQFKTRQTHPLQPTVQSWHTIVQVGA